MGHAEDLFDSLATFYDDLYNEQELDTPATDGKIAFYVERAVQADGPVLEIGCGTGSVYLELLREGVDADGIDVSGEMLEELERKADAEGLDASVRKADMRAFSPDHTYAQVQIPGRGFLHNLTREDQQRTLRNVHEALGDGGTLVCNFFTPNLSSLSADLGETAERRFERDGEEYVLTVRDELDDPLAQVIRGERTVRDPSDEVVAEATTYLKLISRDEFALLLETAGFSDWEVYGDFDGSPLTSPDQEMVWVATK